MNNGHVKELQLTVDFSSISRLKFVELHSHHNIYHNDF